MTESQDSSMSLAGQLASETIGETGTAEFFEQPGQLTTADTWFNEDQDDLDFQGLEPGISLGLREIFSPQFSLLPDDMHPQASFDGQGKSVFDQLAGPVEFVMVHSLHPVTSESLTTLSQTDNVFTDLDLAIYAENENSAEDIRNNSEVLLPMLSDTSTETPITSVNNKTRQMLKDLFNQAVTNVCDTTFNYDPCNMVKKIGSVAFDAFKKISNEKSYKFLTQKEFDAYVKTHHPNDIAETDKGKRYTCRVGHPPPAEPWCRSKYYTHRLTHMVFPRMLVCEACRANNILNEHQDHASLKRHYICSHEELSIPVKRINRM